jgi:hypothetical protein
VVARATRTMGCAVFLVIRVVRGSCSPRFRVTPRRWDDKRVLASPKTVVPKISSARPRGVLFIGGARDLAVGSHGLPTAHRRVG